MLDTSEGYSYCFDNNEHGSLISYPYVIRLINPYIPEDAIMTPTIALISIVIPAAVLLFASTRLGAGIFASALLGMSAAILIGGGLESGAYASGPAVALVLISAFAGIVFSVADPRSESNLDNAVFMAAGNGDGDVSTIPLTIRTAAGPVGVLRPVMVISDNTDDLASFSRVKAA